MHSKCSYIPFFLLPTESTRTAVGNSLYPPICKLFFIRDCKSQLNIDPTLLYTVSILFSNNIPCAMIVDTRGYHSVSRMGMARRVDYSANAVLLLRHTCYCLRVQYNILSIKANSEHRNFSEGSSLLHGIVYFN